VSGGVVDALLRHYAEHDPDRLDSLAVNVAIDLDDPEWTDAEREQVAEARRRLLDRIAELRG
jgi:hypothetical protein